MSTPDKRPKRPIATRARAAFAALEARIEADEIQAQLDKDWADWLATHEHMVAQRQQRQALAALVDDWDLLPDADPAEFKPWPRRT